MYVCTVLYGKTSIDPRSVRMHLISIFDALMKNQKGFEQHEAFERQSKKFPRGYVNRGLDCFSANEVVDVKFRKLDKQLCFILADDIIGAVITQRREEWNSNFTNLTVHRNLSQTKFPIGPQKR